MKFKINEFITILKSNHGVNLFNPYTDICPINDKPNGNDIRSSNLRKFLEKLDTMNSMLVGEAPGHLGCRRTGYAFTDELTFPLAEELFGIKDLQVATTGGKNKENSAKFMWGVIKQIKNPPMLWNIVPYHPEDPKSKNYPLSNRAPTKAEFELSKGAIQYLLDHGDFDKIIAIGNKAETYLTKIGYDVTKIRHPSFGGSNIFRTKMFEEFELLDSDERKITPNYHDLSIDSFFR